MVAHEQRAMVANFSMHELPRQGKACRLISRQPKLLHPQKNVLQRMTARDAVKPAAHREVRDRDFLFAKRLNGLG